MRLSLRRVAMLALGTVVLLGGAVGCARTPERLWYKPGQRYTMEEFEGDRAACTREGKLDFGCMRARGWVDVSAGGRPAAPEPEPEQSPVRPY
ncbi:MAG: hypothetical protein ACE5JN_11930 [Candidatus Methylomirabilia bacterium]